MTIRSRWSRFLLAGLALLLVRCGSSDEADVQRVMNQLEVEEIRYLEMPDGKRFLEGQVYNPTEQAVRDVQVQVGLYDAKNRRLDQMNILVERLPARQRVSFREPVQSEADARGARVNSLVKM